MAVSIEEALHHIYDAATPVGTERLPLEASLGRVIADDIVATHNLPPFDNSAMDGYAVLLEDADKSVTCNETIFAGEISDTLLQKGQAIKIMTGARIPNNAEAVVPIEDTTQDGDTIILPPSIKAKQHIRHCGEDIAKGEPLIQKGERLNAHRIALLASQGISSLRVYRKVKVAVFASGSELKMHYETLRDTQLYNTNSPTFLARAQELFCDAHFIGTAADTLEDIKAHIRNALDADIIITSGGVSVGDADFTKEAFEAFDFQKRFDKVDIKPGKPTTFGTIGDTLVLNLPGNPLAAALNFELFGQSAILALSGIKTRFLRPLHVKLAEDFTHKGGRDTVVPGYFDGESFHIAEKFAPGMVSPLAKANGWIVIDAASKSLKRGQNVTMIPMRHGFTCEERRSLFTRSSD